MRNSYTRIITVDICILYIFIHTQGWVPSIDNSLKLVISDL